MRSVRWGVVPLPEHQLRRLDDCLAERERELARLHAAHGRDDDALVHQTLLVLGRDPHVLWALDDLCDAPALAERESAVAYFNRYGVPVPGDADVRFVGGDGRLRVEATFVHGPHRYTVVWDRLDGFSVTHDATRRSTI